MSSSEGASMHYRNDINLEREEKKNKWVKTCNVYFSLKEKLAMSENLNLSLKLYQEKF